MADLRLALRTLVRTPFLSLVAIISLALGIGANAAIFSLFNQILLSSLEVEEPGRLVNLSAPGPKPGSQSCNQAGGCNEVFSYAMFRDLEQAEVGFRGIAGHRIFGMNLATSDQTLNGEGMMVSGSYFGLLGLRPALGRLLGPDDDRVVGEHPVAVLGHRFWESRLGADPSILNRTIVVNGSTFTVVGVAPRGFEGTTLGGRPEVYVPLSMRGVVNPTFTGFENRRNYWAYLFARLEPGVSLQEASTRLNGAYTRILQEVEAPLQEGMSEQTMGLFLARQVLMEEGRRGQSSIHGEARTPLLLLLATTGLVLVIACANIANLLLARGAGRAQEMAIRGSLGAGRTRLLRQLLVESVALAVVGGLAGLLVAQWTLALVGSLLPPQPAATLDLTLKPGILLFTGALAVGTGLLFGLYPSLHATRPDLVTALKSSAGQPSGARSAARFRTSLVTAQIALSMALLVSAGLFLRSLQQVSRVDLGMRPDNLVTFGLSPELNGYSPEESLAFFARVEEELAALPGVGGVSGSVVPVLAGSSWGSDVSVDGFESGPDVDSNARTNQVGAGYFGTMGVPLLAGREFTQADALEAPRVAIVNEAFARKFGLDTRGAVGSWMATGRVSDLDIEIVGLVQDHRYNDVKDPVPPMFFLPYRQNGQLGSLVLYARTTGAPEPVLAAINGLVRRLDPNLPVENLRTLEEQARQNVFLDRMIGTLSGAFALLATVLAAVGLYGVLAYSVAQRTREIGLRMALGADSGRVRGMVLGQVGRMMAVGGVLGIAAALGLGRAARSLLYGIEGHDPWVVAAVCLLLGVVALGAGYLPALRASRVDPMVALRYE